MRITQHTDYALRVLIYAGGNPGRLVTIAEIAERFGVSRTHLMKVVNQLVRAGFLAGHRGKGGGLRLARPPEEIRVGQVVRATEPDFKLVECFGAEGGCLLDPGCRLKRALGEALESFLAVLDRETLADLIQSPATHRIVRQPAPLRGAGPAGQLPASSGERLAAPASNEAPTHALPPGPPELPGLAPDPG
jgi:Rrf2 family nitric oxide-sensitive transcriptional repressor